MRECALFESLQNHPYGETLEIFDVFCGKYWGKGEDQLSSTLINFELVQILTRVDESFPCARGNIPTPPKITIVDM